MLTPAEKAINNFGDSIANSEVVVKVGSIVNSVTSTVTTLISDGKYTVTTLHEDAKEVVSFMLQRLIKW